MERRVREPGRRSQRARLAAVTRETKPWTRWWWQGSAVEPDSLTAQLEALKAAGIGGVEITPIYGVRGAEDRFIPYLSDDVDEDARSHASRSAAAGSRGRHGHRAPAGRSAGRGLTMTISPRSIAHKNVGAGRRRAVDRTRSPASGAARPCARQSNPRRQRRRPRRSAARRNVAATGDPLGCAGAPDHRSRRSRLGQQEPPGAGARAGEVSARSAVDAR